MKNCGCRRWRRIYARAAGLVHCIKGVFNYKMQIEDLPQSFFIIHHSFFSLHLSLVRAQPKPRPIKSKFHISVILVIQEPFFVRVAWATVTFAPRASPWWSAIAEHNN